MIELLRHPGFRRLNLYADGELSERGAQRVGVHLSRCTSCREILQSIRAVDRAAQELPAPTPSPDLLNRILERKRQGEEVILPVGDPARPGLSRRTAAVIAASVVLVLASTAVFTLAPDAGAQDSELLLFPEEPQAGERIQVEYRPSSVFTGEDTLVLRARLRTPRDGWENWMVRHETVARLIRRGNVYHGSFRLADSVVYAVFAVEDVAGERIDHKGEMWDFVVHGNDGRPLAQGLEQKILDLDRRSNHQALETARELTTIHPDWAQGWYIRFYKEFSRLGEAKADSLEAVYAKRARELASGLAQHPRPSAEEMAAIVSLSWRADSATARFWKERLIREYPMHPAAVEQRLPDIIDEAGTDPVRAVPGLERLWNEVGSTYPQLSLATAGLRAAEATGDAEAVLRWAPRVAVAGSRLHSRTSAIVLGKHIGASEAVREEAIWRLRRELERLNELRSDERILTHTVGDQRIQNQQIAGQYLGYLGRALLMDGDTASAIKAFDRAVGSHWNIDVFRSVADVKLSLGDTTGALQLLAKVAADPTTSTAFADSVRLRVANRFDSQLWHQWLNQANDEMRRYFLARGVDRPLSGRIRFISQDGRSVEFDGEGSLSLVAFWSSDCPSAVRQMPQLQAISEQLRTSRIRVVTITPEDPSGKVSEFLAKNRYTFPVFYDVYGDARRTFDEWGYPTYFVVDERGRIRFKSYRLDDMPRQIAVLQTVDQRP